MKKLFIATLTAAALFTANQAIACVGCSRLDVLESSMVAVSVGGESSNAIYEEGVFVGNASTFNFVGDHTTATISGKTVTIDIESVSEDYYSVIYSTWDNLNQRAASNSASISTGFVQIGGSTFTTISADTVFASSFIGGSPITISTGSGNLITLNGSGMEVNGTVNAISYTGDGSGLTGMGAGFDSFVSTGEAKIDTIGVGFNLFSSTGEPIIENGLLFRTTAEGLIDAAGGGGGLTPSATYQVEGDYFLSVDALDLNLSFNLHYCEMALSEDGKYAVSGAGGNGNARQTNDYGETWTVAPVAAANYVSMEMDSSGKYRFLGNIGGFLRSDDYGVTYTTTSLPYNYAPGTAMSWDGKYWLAMHGNTNQAVLRSDDYGVTFTTVAQFTGGTPYEADFSETGQYGIIGNGANSGYWTSNDYGITWTTRSISGGSLTRGVEVSGDGKYQMVFQYQNNGYISDDYGVSFVVSTTTLYDGDNVPETGCLEMDRTGKFMTVSMAGGLYVSSNSGSSFWEAQTGANSVGLSKDGSLALLGVYNTNDLYESSMLRFIGGGAIGLGTDSPSSKFDVVDGSITIRGINSNVSGLSIRSKTDSLFEVTSKGKVGIGVANPTYILQVNGEPAANGYTAFTNYSDERLKKDIVSIDDSIIQKIAMLDPVEFEYNEEYYKTTGYKKDKKEKKEKGFVAQKVKDIFPDMVGTQSFILASTITPTAPYEIEVSTTIDGKESIIKQMVYPEAPEEETYYTLNTSNLQIYLTKALQELFSMFCDEFPDHSNCGGN